MAYHWIEQQAIALLFVLKLNWPATPTYDLSAVCSLQWRTALRSFLFQSIPLEYLVRRIASRNASFRCGILYSSVLSRCSFPSISPPVSPLRYGMVGTVAGDGAPSAKTQNPKQVSLNPKAQLPQITSPANLLLDTRTRTNQEGWQSFSL